MWDVILVSCLSEHLPIYADDVLLAPNATANWQALQFQIAMHKILRICEKYAINFSVKFYLSKSKCTVCEFHPKLKPANVNHSVIFTSCGSDIEFVIVGHI